MEQNEITGRLRLQLITQKSEIPEIVDEVTAFLEGGGRWVQLRMKDTPEEKIIEAGKTIKPICESYGAVFTINDHPRIAIEVGADGVHIGKNDITPTEARRILGPDRIIGCTANTFEDIEQLSGYPIDYIGLGPYRFTTTKKNLSPVLGTEGYRRIFSQMEEHGIRIPVTVIGGIRLEDIPLLNDSGAKCYAVSGAISTTDDPAEMTGKFLKGICKEHLA